MRIQHNIAAMNSHRQLGNNNNAVGGNLEKLSSGYRINRAGDDAAGLAISEKMRAQIKGLDTAQKNANDGISLVQTAEGALTEVHSMLNRMTELATQSANGTYDNETDRANLQKEVASLQSEIDRISDSTNYNGINLLDGSLSGGSGSAAVKNVKVDNAVTSTTGAAKGKYTAGAAVGNIAATLKKGESVEFVVNYKDSVNGAPQTKTIKLTADEDAAGTLRLYSGDGKSYSGVTAGAVNAAMTTEIKAAFGDKFTITGGSATAGATAGAFVFEAAEEGTAGGVVTGITMIERNKSGASTSTKTTAIDATVQAADKYKQIDSATAYNGKNKDDSVFTINGKKFALALTAQDVSGLGKDVTVLEGNTFTAAHANVISQQTGLNAVLNGTGITLKPNTGSSGSGGLELQIGDTADSYNKMKVSVDSMSSSSLGVSGLDISTQGGASSAIKVIKDAINKVSSTRGDLGAIQNRLDHTINNLGVASENMTAAEARIRDVDMAKEMMTFTKNNILTQASQSMLAQANQIPQGVLQLLQ